MDPCTTPPAQRAPRAEACGSRASRIPGGGTAQMGATGVDSKRINAAVEYLLKKKTSEIRNTGNGSPLT